MTRALLPTAVAALALTVSGQAQAAPETGLTASGTPEPTDSGTTFGLGATLGNPTGASGKLFFGRSALQVELGWAPVHHGDGRATVDYLWHGKFTSNQVMNLFGYVGAGAGVAWWVADPFPYDYSPRDSTRGAAMLGRLPFGLAFHWKGVPIDTAIELAWAPYLIPFDPARGDLAIKLRYYF